MKFENIKGLVFDMDGTIVDNIKYHKNAWIKFLEKHNIHMNADDFNAQNHGTIDEMIVRFFGNNLSENEIKSLGEEKEIIYRELYKEDKKEIEGLTGFLKIAKKMNIKTGLATMGDSNNIDFILDGLNIREYFGTITGGHEINNGKPNPEIFLRAIEKMQLDSEDCVAFEDSIDGIKSALSAKIKVIGITSTHTAQELLENGCFETIENFKNIAL